VLGHLTVEQVVEERPTWVRYRVDELGSCIYENHTTLGLNDDGGLLMALQSLSWHSLGCGEDMSGRRERPSLKPSRHIHVLDQQGIAIDRTIRTRPKINETGQGVGDGQADLLSELLYLAHSPQC